MGIRIAPLFLVKKLASWLFQKIYEIIEIPVLLGLLHKKSPSIA
jgi:hypothetical protein